MILQPFGQVPAIEDGDFKLFGKYIEPSFQIAIWFASLIAKFYSFYAESRAIIRYYATKYADRGTNLLGNTLEERAVVDQWLEVEAHNFNDLVFTIVFNLIILPKMGKVGDSALICTSKEKLAKVLDIYEERLSNTKYLAGDSFTLADLSHLPATRYLMNEAGLGHLVRERKHVNGWWENISSRPAWKKLMKLMG